MVTKQSWSKYILPLHTQSRFHVHLGHTCKHYSVKPINICDNNNNIYVRFGSAVFRQVIGIPVGTNSAPLLADLFLHTFEYDFMVKTMKQDITKAIQFSNTFRYIDDLFSANNVDFGNYISAIYPSELELKDTSTSSTEVCYLDTNIKTGDNTPFRISIYDKREDFAFRIVNFPHMDSNIPANPA